MDIKLLELSNNLNKEKELTNQVTNIAIAKQQETFLESNLGNAINGAIDIGLRALLPEFINEQIIEIKDAFLQEGFAGGLKNAVDRALEIGKSLGGILTGDFKSILQVKDALQAGDLANKVSILLDNVLQRAGDKNILNPNVTKTISGGKDLILGIINKNLGTNFDAQIKSLEKINRYIDNWNKYYNRQDMKNMDRQYKYLQQEMKKIMPVEQIINRARQLENLHNLIKNKGGNFNISKYELELASQLA